MREQHFLQPAQAVGTALAGLRAGLYGPESLRYRKKISRMMQSIRRLMTADDAALCAALGAQAPAEPDAQACLRLQWLICEALQSLELQQELLNKGLSRLSPETAISAACLRAAVVTAWGQYKAAAQRAGEDLSGVTGRTERMVLEASAISERLCALADTRRRVRRTSRCCLRQY